MLAVAALGAVLPFGAALRFTDEAACFAIEGLRVADDTFRFGAA